MAMPSSLPPSASLPCLVFDYGGEKRTMLYSAADGLHRPCELEQLRNKRSWVTSHGWVLAWDPATLSVFLWNLQSPSPDGGKIALPSIAQPPARGIGLRTVRQAERHRRPSLDGGPVRGFEPGESTVMWYCHASEPAAEWVKYDYEMDVGSHRQSLFSGRLPLPKMPISRPASCRGKFYNLRSSAEYGVIEFSPEPVFSTVQMKSVKPLPVGGSCAASASPFFADFDDELYTAYVFFRNTDDSTVVDVGVYLLDFDKRRAVRVKSIGDRAILAGSIRGFGGWCPVLEPGSISYITPMCVIYVAPRQYERTDIRDVEDDAV